MIEQSRIEDIREISLNHGAPFYEVMKIYTSASNKVYIHNFRKEQLTYGHPKLEAKVYDITDRYFKIYEYQTIVSI